MHLIIGFKNVKLIIKKIVSDAKIRLQIEDNMKKPVKVSNFQKRLQEMAKQRQQLPAKKK